MVINNIHDLAIHLGTSVDRLEHDIYKYTDCGAWIKWTPTLVEIGSIVEGSDAEFSEQFVFPFSSNSFDDYVTELEATVDYYWHEANGWDEEDPYDKWDVDPSRNDWDEES